MIGVYQTLSGCALQIKKQAMAIKIKYKIFVITSKTPRWLSITKRRIIDMKKVNKDHDHAGYTSKYEFFSFFFIMVGLKFLVICRVQNFETLWTKKHNVLVCEAIHQQEPELVQPKRLGDE